MSTVVKSMIECSGQVSKDPFASCEMARQWFSIELGERVDNICNIRTCVDQEVDEFSNQLKVRGMEICNFRIRGRGIPKGCFWISGETDRIAVRKSILLEQEADVFSLMHPQLPGLSVLLKFYPQVLHHQT